MKFGKHYFYHHSIIVMLQSEIMTQEYINIFYNIEINGID